MFTNMTGCTIYEKTVLNRSPTYVRHVTGHIYWQPSEGQAGGKDREAQDEAYVCIPAASTDYLPKPDDKIYKGIVNDEQPPQSSHTIMKVKDLRYGSPKVQHIELTVR